MAAVQSMLLYTVLLTNCHFYKSPLSFLTRLGNKNKNLRNKLFIYTVKLV